VKQWVFVEVSAGQAPRGYVRRGISGR
jgi:hypothetical protein